MTFNPLEVARNLQQRFFKSVESFEVRILGSTERVELEESEFLRQVHRIACDRTSEAIEDSFDYYPAVYGVQLNQVMAELAVLAATEGSKL